MRRYTPPKGGAVRVAPPAAPPASPSPARRPKTKAEREILRSILSEARKAFDKDTPEIRMARVARASEDFDFFKKTYFPHYFARPAAKFHQEMIRLALGNLRVVFAAPRGHAKSTVVTFAFVLWMLLTGRSMFAIVVSASAPEARAFLGSIREELEENQKIIGDFGDLKGGPPWNTRVLRLSNGARLRALGAGERFRGMKNRQYRPDLIICDDLEDDEHVESPEQRKKLRSWFFRALTNTLAPDGRLFVVGTILHDDSLLSELLKNEAYVSRLWKAIQDDGTALWPEVWPIAALEAKRKEIGSIAFEQECQNNPAREGIFKREWIRYYDPREIKGKRLAVYMVVDPAIGRKKKNDWFAIAVIGIDKDGTIYVLAVYQAKLRVSEQVDKVCEYYLEYKPLCVGIESIAYQEALKQFIDEKSKKDRLNIPTRELRPDEDKVRRIMVLSPRVERGDVWFHPSLTAWVEDEVLPFPRARHDDGLDALQQAVDIGLQDSMDSDFKLVHGRARVMNARVSKDFLGTEKMSRREMFAGYGV